MNFEQSGSNKMDGKLLIVDGIDGAGKTYLVDFMANMLRAAGLNVIVSGEPGGTPFAERIRGLLLELSTEKVDDLTELLLMFASRNQHYKNLIKPALESGTWVVCSRFTSSSYSYQHFARGLDVNNIMGLENMVLGDFRPHKTIILDVEPNISLARVHGRGEKDRIENEKLAFFEKARVGYLEQARANPGIFEVVDACQDKPGVLRDVSMIVERLLKDGY